MPSGGCLEAAPNDWPIFGAFPQFGCSSPVALEVNAGEAKSEFWRVVEQCTRPHSGLPPMKPPLARTCQDQALTSHYVSQYSINIMSLIGPFLVPSCVLLPLACAQQGAT